MSLARGAAWLTVCTLAAVCPLAAGDGGSISTDGVVHSVQSRAGTSGGFALEYARQLPSGEIELEFVTGTDDVAPDHDPRLDLRADGQPVLVWIRNEGLGPQLFVSRRGPTGWSAPRVLFEDPTGKLDPRVSAGDDWVNVTWRDSTPGGPRFRATLDPDTLEPVFGPEPLPSADGIPPVGPEGESARGTTPEPPGGEMFLAALLPPSLPGDPGLIVIWGIEDEPIPIDYRQSFILPADTQVVRNLQAKRVAGTVIVSFNDDGRFLYTMRRDGMWTALRVVKLDEATSEETAKLRVYEMIRRDAERSTQ